MGSGNPRKSRGANRRRAIENHPTLQLMRRRGIEPIAYLGEAAWNLREWLREVDGDHTLQSVLRGMLPGIRRRIELNLLDAELSRFAPTLPSIGSATAANLVAFIESLELPGNVRILPPPGKPPIQWQRLARIRSLKIALQLCNQDGTPVYDCKSESDLSKIEQLDDRKLVAIWTALEQFQPLSELEGGEPVTAQNDSGDSGDSGDTFQIGITGLTAKQREAYITIQSLPKPLKGTALAKKLGITKGTFLKHYAPQLRLHGLSNQGEGYFIAPR